MFIRAEIVIFSDVMGRFVPVAVAFFFFFFLYLLLVSLEQRRQKDNEVLCQCVCVGLGVCVCILLLFLAQLPRINLLIFFVLRFWDNRQPTCRMRNLIKYTTWKRTASPL